MFKKGSINKKGKKEASTTSSKLKSEGKQKQVKSTIDLYADNDCIQQLRKIVSRNNEGWVDIGDVEDETVAKIKLLESFTIDLSTVCFIFSL